MIDIIDSEYVLVQCKYHNNIKICIEQIRGFDCIKRFKQSNHFSCQLFYVDWITFITQRDKLLILEDKNEIY